jgi:Tol biopolymer transport system component
MRALALGVTVAVLLAGAAVAGGVALPPGAAGTVRIAYTAGRDNESVWVANATGGSRRRLGPGGTPLIAPDADLVAATLFGTSPGPYSGPQIAIYPATGGRAKTYLPSGTVSASPLAWSPDSRYLAVQLFGLTATHSGIAVIDTSTGSVRTVVHGNIDGASFAPALPYRIAYGLQESQTGAADVYEVGPDGSGRVRITHDRRSLNPAWGPTEIAFDHERFRGRDSYPEYQVWMMAPDGSGRTQLTHVKVPPLQEGLAPAVWSADGERLAARLEGQDITGTWTITIQGDKVRELKLHGGYDELGGISLDGSTLLIDYGAFLGSPSSGTVEAVPFGGGPARILIRQAAEPSWNR